MNIIKILRDRHGLTQDHLAVLLNVSQQAIAKWENGEAMPRADRLPELASILQCSIDELFIKEDSTS